MLRCWRVEESSGAESFLLGVCFAVRICIFLITFLMESHKIYVQQMHRGSTCFVLANTLGFVIEKFVTQNRESTFGALAAPVGRCFSLHQGFTAPVKDKWMRAFV